MNSLNSIRHRVTTAVAPSKIPPINNVKHAVEDKTHEITTSARRNSGAIRELSFGIVTASIFAGIWYGYAIRQSNIMKEFDEKVEESKKHLTSKTS
jgi:hypothetical protein